MQLDDNFHFGRYKGLTLRQVYQGSEVVDRSLLKAYVIHKIERPNIQDTTAEFMTYEVSDTLLRAKCDVVDEDYSLSKIIEKLFRDTITWLDEEIGNMSIEAFNIKQTAQTNSTAKIAGGHPEYVDWCMKTVDDFHLSPEVLLELESLTVFRLKGIKVTRKIEDIYEYGPKIEYEKFAFSQYSQKKNQEKYEAYFENKYEGYSDYNNTEDWEEEDDGSCPACGESPCMCSDPDLG